MTICISAKKTVRGMRRMYGKRAALLAAALMMSTVPAWAAQPFSDVPAHHWAYDALEELSAKGVLEGYPDGTFRGSRLMSRYEIAQAVARAMSRDVSGADMEKLKALVAEFEPELEALGVKVDGFDSRLSALEKGLGGWRIYGQLRFDYNAWDKDVPYKGSYTGASVDGFEMNRARIYLHKDLSKKVTFDGRYNNGNMDRFYLQARDFLGWKGFTFKAGQFFLDWEAADKTYIDNDAYAMDTTYRGTQLTKTIGSLGYVTGFAASMRGSGANGVYTPNPSDEVYGLRAKFNFNEKLWLTLNGLITNYRNRNYKQWWAAAGWRMTKGLELRGVYYFEDIADDTLVTTISGAKEDNPTSWKFILDIDQDLLKFTSLWLEYAHIDEGYILDHNPWAFSGIEWPSSSLTWNVTSDTDVYFARAEQKWSRKWKTFERYARYDPDDQDAYDEWTAGVVFQYTPQLSFELAYNDQNGRRGEPDYDNNQIRLRTFLTF